MRVVANQEPGAHQVYVNADKLNLVTETVRTAFTTSAGNLPPKHQK